MIIKIKMIGKLKNNISISSICQNINLVTKIYYLLIKEAVDVYPSVTNLAKMTRALGARRATRIRPRMGRNSSV